MRYANGSRMAFIYQNYGMQDLSSNPDQAAAVQIALWDLSLNNHAPTSFGKDADGSYSSGDENVFQVTSISTDADYIAALTNQYLAASIGVTTPGSWLNASAGGNAVNRGQSMMSPALTINGRNFEDLNDDGIEQSNEPGLAGWTIDLQSQQTNGSWTTVQSTVTADGTNGTTLGAYSFAVLTPGSYRVMEVQQAGWTQTFGLDGFPFTVQNVAGSSAPEVTLNQLNNNTPATISYNDMAGHSETVSTQVAQFQSTYTNGSGIGITINTYCIDLFHTVSSGQTYAVNLQGDLSAYANGSRMAFIYQNYGMQDLSSNPDQAAAVQIALWDLSLNNHAPTSFGKDADGSYSSGDENIFKVTSLGGYAAHIAALTNQYLVASLGATTPGGWLDASAAGDAPNRGQSLLNVRFDIGNYKIPVVTPPVQTPPVRRRRCSLNRR